MTKDNKKLIIIVSIVVALLLIVVIGVFAFRRDNKTESDDEVVAEVTETKKKKRISAPQNVIALEERPVVSLEPFSKDGGRFVSVVVSKLNKEAESAEYEIVYNVIGASAVDASGRKIATPAGEDEGGLQAFIGELDLKKLPTRTENRFGTCSAGGACINNNVDYGSLTINFEGAEKFGVNTTWTYFEDGAKISESNDGHFTIEAAELSSASDYLLMQQIGLPAGYPENVVMVSDDCKDNGTWPLAYQISFTKTPSGLDEASVEFDQNGTGVAVYDGKKWTEYEIGEDVPASDGYIYVLLGATLESTTPGES